MKKIIAITLSLALLAPTFSVPAKAQTVNETHRIEFTDTENKQFRVLYTKNSVSSYFNFNYFGQFNISSALNNDFINKLNLKSPSVKNDLQIFELQAVTSNSGNITTKSTCKLQFDFANVDGPSTIEFIDQKIYAIIGKPFATSTGYAFGEILAKTTDNKYYFIELSDRKTCVGDEGMTSFIKYGNSSLSNKLILRNLDPTNKTQVCNRISSDWESLKNNTRAILSPAVSSNLNWTKVSGPYNSNKMTWAAIRILGPLAQLSALSPLTTFDQINDTLANQLVTNIDYDLNDDGKRAASTIHALASELKKNIELVRDEANPTVWPCDSKLTEFKINKERETDKINNISGFLNALDNLLEKYDKFKAIADTPTGTNGTCDSGDSSITDMIKGAFCSLTVILKEQADKWFLWAKGWMVTVIGVEESGEKGEVTDDPLQSDGASPADSSAETPPEQQPAQEP